MFGLTKREQRWKAEQQAAEVVFGLIATVVRATADARIAEAQAEAGELERLRAENATLRAATPHTRPCSCHPDDNPPKPCARQFALNECRAAAKVGDGKDVTL